VVKGNTGASAFKVVGAQQLPAQVDLPAGDNTNYADASSYSARQPKKVTKRAKSAPASTPTVRAASFTKLDVD
jgi:hypothetical protein